MAKVLLIEDNLEIRENLGEILELAGYKVITSGDGNEALIRMKQELPDIILCDIMMPEVNGYEVLSSIRSNPKTAKIPFVFITAKSEESEKVTAEQMGANGYLCKPFDDSELLEVIRNCLQ